MLEHCLSYSGNYIASQNNILLYGRISEVQIAVFESQLLIGFPRSVDLKRQLVIAAFSEYLYLFRNNLYVACRDLRVFGASLPDGALDRYRRLLVDALDDAVHLLVFDDDLCGPVEVAYYSEREAVSYFPDILQPAGDLDLLAGIFKPEFIAGMCS